MRYTIHVYFSLRIFRTPQQGQTECAGWGVRNWRPLLSPTKGYGGESCTSPVGVRKRIFRIFWRHGTRLVE